MLPDHGEYHMGENENFSMTSATYKAPFPYFGGKTKAAELVWRHFGQVDNYVEPFAGSLAVLLNRPAPHSGPETVNDLDCLLINAWRGIQREPEAVARECVGPVAEVDLESRHAWLLRTREGIRERLGDPLWCDPVAAAWWIKGATEWIGSGWCAGEGPWSWTADGGWEKGGGIKRKLPHLGNAGTGVNRQLPHLGDAGTGGEYEARVAWVTDWMTALRDRLCSVRIACGDWRRVLGPIVTEKHGLTAVFLDPPYDGTEYVYGRDGAPVSKEVRQWAIANGGKPLFRIALAGYRGEHDMPDGWFQHSWLANGGYQNDGKRERIWFSPHCVREGQRELFDLRDVS